VSSGESPGGSPAWHALEVGRALEQLDVTPDGLSAEEAARRLGEHGPNQLPEAKKRGPLLRFLLQFHNILIYILIAAAGVTGLLGEWIDTAVILAVVVINALIGFIQEGKAEKALEAISRELSPHATVRRDGRRDTIDAKAVVPGDIVLLKPGARVPALFGTAPITASKWMLVVAVGSSVFFLVELEKWGWARFTDRRGATPRG
jgi:magnesium-transporting ATPase (P-type)